MKTKTLLLLCLFLGIGLTQLSAQNGKNGTGSVQVKSVWDSYNIPIPVICNGEEQDMLVGSVYLHGVMHFKDGVWLWNNVTYFGEVTSKKTGVVYSVKDIFKISTYDLYGFGHCKLEGSDGSHYTLNYEYDLANDSFTFTKAVCD